MSAIGRVLMVVAVLVAANEVLAQPFGPPVFQALVDWLQGISDTPSEPFQLDRDEQQRIDSILTQWEQAGTKVASFSCVFTRWDYDRTFGPKKNDFLISERQGVLKFRAPDSGLFRETDAKLFDAANGKYADSEDVLDQFCCDGKTFYWLHPKSKTIDAAPLPSQWIGRATRDGLMPFLFPIEAQAIAKRYWLRETTPHEQMGKQIWIEAWPKTPADAVSVKHYEVILSADNYMPLAMQITLPNGKDRTAYLLEDLRVNDAAEVTDDDFSPKPPKGWQLVPASR